MCPVTQARVRTEIASARLVRLWLVAVQDCRPQWDIILGMVILHTSHSSA